MPQAQKTFSLISLHGTLEPTSFGPKVALDKFTSRLFQIVRAVGEDILLIKV